MASLGEQTSVCLLVYNHAHLIESTLQSILDQTLTGYELIVSDDCSTDGTWERLQELAAVDARMTLIRTPSNLGMARNANFAVEHAARPYVAILHHDDLYRADLLQKWASVLERHSRAAFVFNAYGAFNSTGVEGPTMPGECVDGTWFLERHLLARLGCVVRGTAMVRRAAWNDAGGMRVEFGLLADVDLWMRLSARAPVAYVPEPLISVRQQRSDSYPDIYKSWSWTRQNYLFDIHAANTRSHWDINTVRGRWQWWTFRWRITRETAKWLAYALVRKRRDMLSSSHESVSPYDLWPLHVFRRAIGIAAAIRDFVPWAVTNPRPAPTDTVSTDTHDASATGRARRYSRYAGAMVGQAVVQRLAGMLTNMVLARVLGVTGFGAYTLVATTASSAYAVTRMGVEASIVVQTAELAAEDDKASQGQLLGAGLLLLLLAACIGLVGCVGFAEQIAGGILGDRSLAGWIRVAGVSAFLLCLSQFCYVAMAGLQRFVAYSKVAAALAVIQALATSIAGAIFGLVGAVAAMVGTQALGVTAMAVTLRNGLRAERVHLVFRRPSRRAWQLLTFGLPFYAGGLVSVSVTYFLQGALARHAGLDALGYLRVMVAVTTVVTFMPASAATAIVVMLTNATRTGHFAVDTIRSLRIVALFSLVVAAIVSVALPWLIPAFFGAAYQPAVAAASIALVSAVFAGVTHVIANALLSAGRVASLFVSTALQMLAFLIAGTFLIAQHGLMGYVLAEFLGFSVLLLATYGCALPWLRQNAGASKSIARLLGALSLLLISTAVSVTQPIPRGGVAAIVGVAVVIALCVLGYRAILEGDEREVLARACRRRTFRGIPNAATTD